MLFFMPDVKVSEEIETSTPSSIEGKKTKGFLFSVTIIHLLEQGMMLQQYTKNLPSNLLRFKEYISSFVSMIKNYLHEKYSQKY